MASMKRPRLKAVEALPRYRLRLTFVDDKVRELDFAPLWQESPGLAPLQLAEVFAEASLIEGEGWAVVWPSADIQIGADTLWLDAQAQNAPDENTRIFAQWRARNHLSLAQAAEALGLTTRTISAFGTGARPVPRYIALACIGWEAEHRREAA
ncbi:Protein of unknown function (DUF2442) [Thiorhodovibrio frisius]|uniref:DUF2442 domain-containing protein n=2 Tax=Thiorhodovibrio frisius TaxID=631362 RepID=H8YY67_9GAMM|nr:Protein of unknown function (DUF2442) [Thiorhodovibrio frisius]WPL23524.1 hypothetical protein Thiofri_03714 [Thiorhodovibrio frisius]